MTDDPKLQMARRVAADHLRARNPEAVMVDNIRNGNCDGFFGVTIALAAIEECTERAATSRLRRRKFEALLSK